jgi:hypothetical protein
MWLFDDILKKPTDTVPLDPLGWSSSSSSPVGGGATGDDGVAPLIVKTETETVYGANSEALALKAALPEEPTVHAEEDASSILMSETPPVTPIAPIAPIVVTPSIVSDVAISPIVSTPIEEVPPQVVSEVLPMPTVSIPVTVAAPAIATEGGTNLFESIIAAPTLTVETITKEEATVEAPIAAQTEATEDFSTPRAFIEKSLASVALMLENIDRRYSAKKEEEEGYRKEKMRFAELEKNAYIESEIMTREREHAVRMQKMFESELETDSANRNAKVAQKDAHEGREKAIHKKHHEEKEEALAA